VIDLGERHHSAGGGLSQRAPLTGLRSQMPLDSARSKSLGDRAA
jgi:hypothetical protein